MKEKLSIFSVLTIREDHFVMVNDSIFFYIVNNLILQGGGVETK